MSVFDGIDVFNKWVFLSGPMTGKDDWNRAAFAEVELAADEAGAYEVFNPAADAPHGEDSHTHAHWMLRTLNELTSFNDWRRIGLADNVPTWDVIVMLPGWRESAGARIEHDVAEACGIEIVEI